MKYVAVIPFAYPPYFNEFIETVKLPRDNLLIVNDSNPPGGIGIMRAHNMGIDFMGEQDADWLIVMSASIRFGAPGGQDFIDLLENHSEGLHVVNGAGIWEGHGEDNIALGWHLTAFRRDVIEAVGRWDLNFTPYGFDDVDMTLRMRKAIGPDNLKIDSLACDFRHVSTSHSIQLAGVEAPSEPRIIYFMNKWGRHPGAWQWDGWDHPFNNPEHSIKYWPTAHGGNWDD